MDSFKNFMGWVSIDALSYFETICLLVCVPQGQQIWKNFCSGACRASMFVKLKLDIIVRDC